VSPDDGNRVVSRSVVFFKGIDAADSPGRFYCKKCYYLGENMTIDEKLEAFRGRCRFKQHTWSKPNKYGIKIYALVEAKVLYTYNLEIYAGKQPDGPYQVSNKPADVVKMLEEPFNSTGRNITADNWFTDVNVVFELRKRKLSYVGTLKKEQTTIAS
jgi:hypothetical protein